MCGICGEISNVPSDEQAIRIKILLGRIKRRGPDGEGIWSDDQGCIFGFRRLAILDLSPNGDQPMATRDGRYVIVFNGELYNFREIRFELQQQGVVFRSSGDTEVVLNALAQWGIDALTRFNGMFAIAFYDTAEKKLLLARDHAGIKPLYYLRSPNGFVFGSQYDQLLSHPWGKNLRLNLNALALYLRFGYIPAPNSLFENTFMLEPGAWLIVSATGDIREGHFFEFPVYREPELSGDDAYEAVDAALTKAVQRQMISDVPIGAFLSGGIDSPLVAAKMRQVSNSEIKAFTIGNPHTTEDEAQDAAIYAEKLNLTHFVQNCSYDDVLGLLDQAVSSCGEPIGDYSIIPTMLVSKLAREQVTVALSGDGGDELFWGYYGRFASVMERSADFAIPYPLRILQWGLGRTLHRDSKYTPPPFVSVGKWYQIKHTHLWPKYIHKILPDLRHFPSHDSLFDFRDYEPGRTAQWLRWNEFVGHLTRVLLKVDRASMYHSLEVRVPLLDREVIDVATRIDWRSCLDLQSKTGKIPLRESLRRHCAFQTQSKRGFSVPIGKWLRQELRPVFEESVLGRQELLGIPLNRQAVADLYAKHVSNTEDSSRGLWILLSLALWEKKITADTHLFALNDRE